MKYLNDFQKLVVDESLLSTTTFKNEKVDINNNEISDVTFNENQNVKKDSFNLSIENDILDYNENENNVPVTSSLYTKLNLPKDSTYVK